MLYFVKVDIIRNHLKKFAPLFGETKMNGNRLFWSTRKFSSGVLELCCFFPSFPKAYKNPSRIGLPAFKC